MDSGATGTCDISFLFLLGNDKVGDVEIGEEGRQGL